MTEPAADDYPHFLGSEIPQGEPESSLFHVLPVPLERSVSYGAGTGLGPGAILAASWQLEAWDGTGNPGAAGIHTCPAVDCSGAGDAVMARIAAATRNIVGARALPVVLGGEHTVTYGVVQGLLQAGVTDLGIVQIDAHADLRDRYEGDPLSHASVMHRCVDLGVPLYQLGVRALCEEEVQVRRERGVHYRDAHELVPQQVGSVSLPADFPRHVFVTLDVDGLDPSVIPATGTPVPGGLGWYQTLALFESLCRQRRLIGFDIMEFAPIAGLHAWDFAAALLTYKMMGIAQRAR